MKKDIDDWITNSKSKLICLASVSPTIKGACVFCMLTCISMVIGILVVYYTSPKPLGKTCIYVLKSDAHSSISADSHPHSIAVGDFNNDGLLDIVVPNSGTNNIGVFLRDSNRAFKDQITYSTGLRSIPYAVATADFNGDQRLDIVVANFGSNNVGIFLGTDDGTFRSQTMFSTRSSRPRWVAAGDFNMDKLIDLVVVNYGTNDIGIFLGDGHGNFDKWTTFTTGFDSIPYAVAIADLNHDNTLDIVVANYGTKKVGVFLGYGNGALASQTNWNIDHKCSPYSIAVADLNNDTHVDIIVACSNTNNVAVLLGLGNGLFSLPIKYSTGNTSSPYSVAIGDFDNDNKLDIAVATYSTSSVAIFFGHGNGTFSNQTVFYTSRDSNPYSIATGDFNNDTRLDIAVINYELNYVDIVLTYRNYSFSGPTTYQTTSFETSQKHIFVTDFNNDSQLDIIIINYDNNNIDIFLGYGNGRFPIWPTYSIETELESSSVAVGDFNSDFRLDIVVANYQSENIVIFPGNGRLSKRSIYSSGENSQPHAIDIADLNNDSHLDIVVGNYERDNIGIFLGNGDGTFSSQQVHSTGNGSRPVWVGIADFNNDKRLDIAVINSLTGTVGIFFGNNNNTFSYQIVFVVGTGAGPNGGAIGDLNNDGRMDIVVNIYFNRAFDILLGYGNGTFFSKTRYSVGSASRPSWCTIADWNNDKRLDIIVSSCDTNNILVFIGYGDGTFVNERTYSTGRNSCPFASGAGDFNKDGLLDIAVIDPNTNIVAVFLEYTYMSGISEGKYSTGSASHPRAIGLSQFTDDLQLDVVIANYGLGSVGFLKGQTNGTFPLQEMLSTGALSFPTSIATNDFNNDSKLDILVVNPAAKNIDILYGYGNGSFASPKTYSAGLDSFPQSVTFGDFNNDNRVDIAVVYSGSNSVSAILRYDTVVLKRQKDYFTGPNSYPHAVSVGDFNNDGWPDFVTVNRGSESISIFLGMGNGTFSSPITYTAGRGSPSYSVVVGHFNNDSYLDIAVSHWLSTMSIFLGFGNGSFSKPRTLSTGDSCYPVGITTGDLNNDSWLDIVVVCNINNDISIFLGYGNGTFAGVVKYPTGANTKPIYAAVGDFNNDNHLDIVVTNFDSSEIIIFQGYGDGTVFAVNMYSTGSGSNPRPIAIADLDKDGKMDIAVGNSGSNTIGVFFGYGNSSFSSQKRFSINNGSTSYGLVIRDLNNDNQLDIAVANYGGNTVAILLGLGNRTFFNPLTYSTGDYSQPSHLAVADFNNDNRLDIVVAQSGIHSAGVFFGYASEDFLFAPAYPMESSSQPTSIAVGDFDNDARLDLVITDNATNNVMIVFGSGGGTFTRQRTYSTGNGSHPCSVAVGDFNNDNRLDIVVANSGTNNIDVFLGNATSTFSSQMTYFTGLRSQPYSVAVVDFDNDTRLDIAVANYGSGSLGVFFGYGNGSFSNQLIFNTGFGSQPIALAIGDVNNDDLADIVAVNNGYGNIDILMKTC